MNPITFYFDLGSPYAYLAAERIGKLFKTPVVWQPILLGALFQRFGEKSWSVGSERSSGIKEVERRAALYGLPSVVWPHPWPSNYLFAMRAATVAKELNQTRELALTAFRLAFREGKDLSLPENIFEAVRRTGLDTTFIQEQVQSQKIKDILKQATTEAGDKGVDGVPTVIVDGKIYFGDDQLEEAARFYEIK